MSGLGNKDILAKNLQHLMNIKKIDRNELCEALGFKYSTVSEWLAGRKYPRIDSIELMANYFGVKKSDIIEDKSAISTDLGDVCKENIYMVPVFDSVSAGFGASAIDYVIDYYPAIINNPSERDEYIYINVKGDSMFPTIEEGDTILVHRQTSVDSGDVAVMLVDGEEAVVKKVVYGPTWIELHSYNPMYPVRRFDNEEVLHLEVLGLVKKVMKNLH